MSSQLKDSAGWAASFPGTVWKQVFHRVPKIPSHIDLSGKTVIVTGATGGIGLEAARQLLEVRASRLILTARTQSKGETAAAELRSKFPKADIRVWTLEMESYESVRQFAGRCETELDHLDVVILNAGMGRTSFIRTGDGRESTLQVNYLSTALLAVLLLPILRSKAIAAASPGETPSPGRLTVVGSDMAHWVNMKEPAGGILDAVDSSVGFQGMDQYAKTKLFLTMIVSKLAEVVSADDVIVNVVNPSGVRGTSLMRDAKGQYAIQAFVYINGLLLGRNLTDGTRQYLHSALVLGKESHGSFGDWQIRPYPPFMYTDAGIRMTNKLWEETGYELRFAEVDAILEKMKH
ncbi:related to short-chain dehydrogenase/reductase family protein, putative [Cephalotrichum gorgonifer]|uniref:Related to short-chain dehydrogenase/reductase family protein, putative n=1 Tax=Cephalotrichum gorgonifer TaxID=2041049 RepID=A0AAE8MQF5_9PEZI|nr:related to short-chain dehydrogenase/reductase family protein, putative [Cephalotrichum gorgonifer]